jgi:hypothetical protein
MHNAGLKTREIEPDVYLPLVHLLIRLEATSYVLGSGVNP